MTTQGQIWQMSIRTKRDTFGLGWMEEDINPEEQAKS
jgi:hypothetical protein